MEDKFYIIGEKIAGKYPSGRYAATKVHGVVHDHYIIVGVLDYPEVRAVANPTAWSGAEEREYGSMVTVMRGETMREPEEYTGYVDDSLEGYDKSLFEAMARLRIRYAREGDIDAAFEVRRREQKKKHEMEARSR